MPRKKLDESGGNVLGACEYQAGGMDCDRHAVVQINGWALCIFHKKYGEQLSPRPNSAPNPPLDSDTMKCQHELDEGLLCEMPGLHQLNGQVLCDLHFGAALAAEDGTPPPAAETTDANTQKIEAHNEETTFRNAQADESAFTKDKIYRKIKTLCDEVESNMNRFTKGKSLAAHLANARLTLLDEMAGPPPDDKQIPLPLPAPQPAAAETQVEETAPAEVTVEPELTETAEVAA